MTRIKLERADRLALLQSLKSGYLETDSIKSMPSSKLKIEVVESKDEIRRLEELNEELKQRGYDADSD